MMKLEFKSAPRERVKSMLRWQLYEKTDEQREQLKQDKRIKQVQDRVSLRLLLRRWPSGLRAAEQA
jgi:hypothetical protein